MLESSTHHATRPPGPGGIEAFTAAFEDEFPGELRQSGEHMEGQLAFVSGGPTVVRALKGNITITIYVRSRSSCPSS